MRQALDIRFLAGVGVGLALSGWFFWRVEWGPMLSALGQVKLEWIALAAVILFGEHILRALRWSLLVRHLDAGITVRTLFSAAVIGAAMNTLLPLRGGDLIRPGVVARERGLPYASVFATTVVERIFDVFGLVCVLIATFAAIPPDMVDANPAFATFRFYGWAFTAALAIAFVVGVLLVSTGARALVLRLFSPLPEPMQRRLLTLFDQVVEGVSVVGRPMALLPAAGLTLMLWFGGFLAILCLFQAFSLDLPLVAGLFTQCALALVVALPQAPGYWGPFQVAISETMVWFGSGEEFARASAILFWAVSFVPVTLVGIVASFRVGRGLFDVHREMLREHGEPADQPE